MVKHTQTTCCQQPTNCLSVFDHFVRLALKGLLYWYYIILRLNVSTNDKYVDKSEIKYFPSWHLPAQTQQLKHENNQWVLFKVNNKDIVFVSLLSTWNWFHIVFWCFHYFWTSKPWLGSVQVTLQLLWAKDFLLLFT